MLTWRFGVIIGSALIFLAITGQSSLAKQTINMQPLVIARDGSSSGYITATKVLTRIYQRINRIVVFKTYPQKESLDAVNRGEADGELMRISGMQEKYPNLLEIPTSYVDLNFRIYGLPTPGQEIEKPVSLQGRKVGYMHSVILAERLTRNMNRTAFTTLSDLFDAIEYGQIDVAVATDLVAGLELIRNRPESKITVQGPLLKQVQLHHYLHKRHGALASRLDAEIRSLRENGLLEQFFLEAFRGR